MAKMPTTAELRSAERLLRCAWEHGNDVTSIRACETVADWIDLTVRRREFHSKVTAEVRKMRREGYIASRFRAYQIVGPPPL